MISVIIPKYEDDLYLVRCLNSIIRQTYKDIEILVIDGQCEQEIINKYNLKIIKTETPDDNGLNKAIASAQGEYLFFCSVTTVLANNTLSELLKEDDDTFVYVDGHVLEANEFKRRDMLLSCYGKLFSKEKIIERKIQFYENSIFSEYFFVIGYISGYEKISKREDLYIYITEWLNVCTEPDVSIDSGQWRKGLKDMKDSADGIRELIRNCMIQAIRQQMICSEDFAQIVEEEFHSDYELNYVCAAPVLKLLWNDVTENKDEKAFESFRNYLAKYENEDFIEILFRMCGLSEKHYKYIKNNKAKECLFLMEESKRLDNEKNEIEDTVETIIRTPSSGLTKIGSEWYYYSNGKLDTMYRGMAKNQYGWWYVSEGKIDFNYKGLCRNSYDWWYISKGTIDKSYTGLAMNEDGVWMYVTHGAVDRQFVGLVETKGGYKYISNGVIDKEYTGLIKTKSGKWVYIENGTINTNFIGLARNEYGWWYVENGTIDFTYNGYARNSLGWCKVENGKTKPFDESEIVKKMEDTKKVQENIKIENITTTVTVAEKEEKAQENIAEVALDFYRNGQLGFMTILKSMGAWIKYKFK